MCLYTTPLLITTYYLSLAFFHSGSLSCPPPLTPEPVVADNFPSLNGYARVFFLLEGSFSFALSPKHLLIIAVFAVLFHNILQNIKHPEFS